MNTSQEDRDLMLRTVLDIENSKLYQELRSTYRLWRVVNNGSFIYFVCALLSEALKAGIVPRGH